MADISAFPTIKKVLDGNEHAITFTAGAAIKAGQIVGFNATGVSGTVEPMVAGAGEHPIGVALGDAASGKPVSVAVIGAIVVVANADDTTAIDAGDWLETNDNAVKGTVSAVNIAASGSAIATVHWTVIGKALDDIAGGGTGRMMVIPMVTVQQNSS